MNSWLAMALSKAFGDRVLVRVLVPEDGEPVYWIMLSLGDRDLRFFPTEGGYLEWLNYWRSATGATLVALVPEGRA